MPSLSQLPRLNESSTSSVCLCTDASTTKLLGTWWTTAHQYPTLPIANGYVLPVVMKSPFHVTGSVPMDVGHYFAVAGPTVWNSLPEDMRDPEVSEDSYRQSLKTFLIAQYYCVQKIRGFFCENALYKSTFDIWLLTLQTSTVTIV